MAALLFAGMANAVPDRKQELGELRNRIEKLQRDLGKSEESRVEAADALRESEKSISEANRLVQALEREQLAINQQLAEIGRRMAAARAEAARQQDLLDRMIRHQYMYGGTDSLRLVLEGRDAAQVERQMHYFGYISKERLSLVARQKAGATALAELESGSRQKQAELSTNADLQKAARAELQAERNQRQKVFAKIRAEITHGKREIGRLKRDEDRLTKLLEQLAKKSAARKRDEDKAKREDRPAVPAGGRNRGEAVETVADATLAGKVFATLRGKLKLPVRGELQGRYGSPREEGGVTWKGLFIKAPTGTPVRAVADGHVVHADWMRGFGNLIVIDHGDGYQSIYANNESLLKRDGEKTHSGEIVATVGSTGGALESGVYFELRHEGNAFDPMKWVGR